MTKLTLCSHLELTSLRVSLCQHSGVPLLWQSGQEDHPPGARVGRTVDRSPVNSEERMSQQVGGGRARHSSSSSSPAQLDLEVGQLWRLLSPEPRDSDETEVRDLLHHGGHSGEAAHQHLAAHPTHAEDSCKEREVRGQQRWGEI